MLWSQNPTFELKGKNKKAWKNRNYHYHSNSESFEIILLLSNRISAEIVLIYIFYT